MLHHILDFQCGAFTITGCEQSSTINERLYIIFPGTWRYKLERKVGTGMRRSSPRTGKLRVTGTCSNGLCKQHFA